MAAEESFHTASDGAKIFVRTWRPAAEPKAVLQIHHGLGEHCGRYAGFAAKLNAAGFLVVAHDARGHGRTSSAEGSLGLGIIACGAEGAISRMVMDFTELLCKTRDAHPGLPMCVFGHSMGAVIAQLCVGAGAGGVAVRGLILCAPPARLPKVILTVFKAIVIALQKVYGDHGLSHIPGKLTFEKFQARVMKEGGHEGPVTGWEWLNRDEAEVAKYIEDPFCGHDVCVGFWAAFAAAFDALTQRETYAKMPANLPICIFAGTGDSCAVNDFGKFAYQSIQEEFVGAGKVAPKVVLFPQARHEILLETNREEVVDDMLRFLAFCVGGTVESKL